MRRIIRELVGRSYLVGTLPKGCKLCAEGKKMVLFVTGICDSSCYYCPLSENKMGKDVIFADEMPVEKDADIIEEAHAIGSKGAGISGGDPLNVLDRTLHYLSLLKENFGTDFHTHLYTSKSTVNNETIEALIDAGLDEIRFHPQTKDLSGIRTALAHSIDVGVEVPVIPGADERLKELIDNLENLDVKFINLNELEASETNFEKLTRKGMKLVGMHTASIEGSFETAMKVLEWASNHTQSISVHYCSAHYKDAVQMRNRLERRLERVIRPFEMHDDEDALLVLGIIRAQHGSSLTIDDLFSLQRELNELEIPEELYNLDKVRMRIEIAPWVLEEIIDELRRFTLTTTKLEMGIAYEYPSYDRLQTLFEPL